MEAKKFKNFTNEAFSWKWNGIVHNFAAGMEIFLEADKADHFAKHLVDQELNRKGIVTDNRMERERLTALCFPSDEVVTPLEALNIEEKKKRAPKKAKKVEEEEFPELED